MATGEASTREAQLRKPFANPFFLYFMFSLLCATLRWQWQGVLWTSIAALTIFVGLGIYSGDVLREPAFELNCFLTRSVYLVVAALMRGYLSTYEGEVRIALAAQAERTATMEDRLRLARDLHDWLLQSLTGTAL